MGGCRSGYRDRLKFGWLSAAGVRIPLRPELFVFHMIFILDTYF